MKLLKDLLGHPLTKGLDIDSRQLTERRKLILQDKPFLRKIYDTWYRKLIASKPDLNGVILELGSGAGFLDEYLPGLMTTEVFFCRGVKMVLDGQQLPFADASLAAVMMVDVFHHLPNVHQFFNEASRCVKTGGRICMIEPWNTRWSKWVFQRFHHEVFDPAAGNWEFVSSGPLSGANQALPWIVFKRDRIRFETEFPQWRIIKTEAFMPFVYLLSGGIATRNLMPGWSFGFWSGFERLLLFKPEKWAMFAHIVLERN